MDVKSAADAALSPAQTAALKKLHDAATSFESVFIGMLFKSMRETQSGETLAGKQSNAEQTFASMLDDSRAQSLSKSGSLGIARVLEGQLRNVVLADAAHESTVTVPRQGEP